jgi:hypothetical protein
MFFSSSRLLGLLLGTLLLIVATAASASAADFERLGQFADPPLDGQTGHHQHLAVLPGSNDLLVANPLADRIDVYAPTGAGGTLVTSFGTGTLTDPDGVAVDRDSGAVYIADAGNDRIVKYTSDGTATPTFTRVSAPGFTSPALGSADGEIGRFDAALAVAPDGDLWVADPGSNRIKRFNSDGSYDNAYIDGAGSPSSDQTGLNGEFTGLMDIAVDSTGDVIAVDQHGDIVFGGDLAQNTSRAERFGADGTWKAGFDGVPFPGAVAVFSDDQVVLSSNQNSYNQTILMTLEVLDADGTPVQTLVIPDERTDQGSAAMYSMVTGIGVAAGPAHRTYAATDSPDGVYGEISIQAYEIPQPAAPTVVSQAAIPTYAEAELRARINPALADTTYRFEYGPTDAYGSSTAESTIPAGKVAIDVTASAAGLNSGATYHYRVVAHNAMGSATGPDRTFTTLTRPGADSCPNAALRKAQGSDFLPNCRAWEMVSPVDKNGGGAGTNVSYLGPSQISADGSAAAYTSNDTFADPQASSGNVYISTHDGGNWSTKSILPPNRQNGSSGNIVVPSYFFSPDLSKTIVMTPYPLTADSPPDTRNLYVRDNAAGTYRLITKNAPASSGLLKPTAVGVSADYSRALVQSPAALTPDAPAGALANLYEWVAGTPDTFRLVGILPDGSVAPDGASAGGAAADATQGIVGNIENAMSQDGSRIFFSAPAGSSKLYVRQDGQTTTQISSAGTFWTATPSGSRVLLTDSTTGSDVLQRYDVDSGAMTDLSPDDEPADGSDPDVQGVLGASEDLSRVYFTAAGQLVAGKGTREGRNLYLSENGTVTYIATLLGAAGIDGFDNYPQRSLRAVTDDGRWLAFVSAARLTDYDNDDHLEVYLYDAVSGALTCPSCSGEAGDSRLLPTDGNTISSFYPFQHRQENISADGSRLYFQTSKALVPQDGNGASDVYEWSGGRAHLLSSGSGEGEGSQFMGTSSTGDDVFITTRDRLVGQDKRRDSDIYDVRVGGGLADQMPADPAPPCSGESCRGLPSGPAARPVTGSGTQAGTGDLTAVRSATKASVKVSGSRVITGSAGVVQVKVSGKGRVSISGTGLRAVSRAVGKAGTYKVAVALTTRAASTLRKRHRLTATVRVTFTPASGKRATATARLTFKRAKATASKRATRAVVGASSGRGR